MALRLSLRRYYTSGGISLQNRTQNIVATKENNNRNVRTILLQLGFLNNVTTTINPSPVTHVLNRGDKHVIRILAWTNRSTGYNRWFGRRLEGVADCKTPIPCEYSNNHSLYNSSDLILFHTRLALRNDAFPPYRLPHQHWVTFLRETPVRFSGVQQPHNTWFNWTIAYTSNADVVRPYGICLPIQDKIAKDPSSITDAIRRVYRNRTDSIPWQHTKMLYKPTAGNYAKGKTRTVLWAVSNCITPSRRERYVEELKLHIKVDIMGKCGDGVCKSVSCKDVFQKYKFYLSFENSLCTDYITEKLWYRMEQGILPIVRGGADYKAYLPAHSYIDVRDFASPKALAEYLHKLDNNDDLYNEYFVWRQNYTCHSELPGNDLLCDMCQFMNDNLNKVNIIPDVNIFWSKDDCSSPETYYGGIFGGL
ncbi:hypothetical protein NP493_311g02059 [Ridgeia piscesae]|uniref:Fucosyltransferase n=1 Tax=Ridgeia piscesae TaxID=27915 RepID=A0AAD9L4U4_RIDPI|nr:hypothetical protein NP493_311g02059 [Ridgeia piscesae]